MKILIYGYGHSGKSAILLLQFKGFSTFIIDDKLGVTSSEVIPYLDKFLSLVVSPRVENDSFVNIAKEHGLSILSEIDLASQYYLGKKIAFVDSEVALKRVYGLLIRSGFKVEIVGRGYRAFSDIVTRRDRYNFVLLNLTQDYLRYSFEIAPDITVYSKSTNHTNRLIARSKDSAKSNVDLESFFINKLGLE